MGLIAGSPIGSQYGFRQAPGAATGAFSGNNVLANPTFPAGQAGAPARQTQGNNASFSGSVDGGDFMIKNLREAQSPKIMQKKEAPQPAEKIENIKPVEETKAEEDDDDAYDISYTYKPGDTFGQVVKNLGLGTKKGLWGDDGDVEYYTKQLEKQLWKSGVWPKGSRQNIPIGTTIKLRRRPETE